MITKLWDPTPPRPPPQKNRIVLLLSTIGNLYNSDVGVVIKKPMVVLYYTIIQKVASCEKPTDGLYDFFEVC